MTDQQDPQQTTCCSLDDFPDPSTFVTVETYAALLVPVKQTAKLRRALQGLLFCRPKTKGVYNSEEHPDKRILVLNSKYNENNTKDDFLANINNTLLQTLIASGDCELTSYTIASTYDDLSADQVLRRILPANCIEIPCAFEQVGSICHVNLREDLVPYQYWVGKVLLDKNQPTIKTVVNKLGQIETEYRTFGMQVIAGYDGDGWSRVTVKEEGCQFELDFQQVYWNSRLAGEHRRIVQYLRREQEKQSNKKPLIVADLMCGIGPFAVPLTAQQQQCDIRVYANDLNPCSFHYLTTNAAKNKCQNLHCFNLDGRAFVHQLQDDAVAVDQVLMNLPKTAPEFLDAFRGFTTSRPRIHVHCFASKASETDNYPDALDRCAAALGTPLERDRDQVSVKTIRNVAPNKNMVCVSFVLPIGAQELPRIDVGTAVRREEADDDQEPKQKRARPADED
jgi:tRNA (guanine37-N1)-methyltransferase